MDSPYQEEKPPVRKIVSHTQKTYFNPPQPSSSTLYSGFEDTYMQKRVKNLKDNPQIAIQHPTQPMFQTRMLGRSQSSIQIHIPRQVSDQLNIQGMKQKQFKISRKPALQNLKYAIRHEKKQSGQDQKEFLDLKLHNQQSIQKYKEVILKLLTDQNYALTKEYLEDDSYLDFKQQMIPLNSWKQYTCQSKNPAPPVLNQSRNKQVVNTTSQKEVVYSEEQINNTLNFLDEFTKEDEDYINSYHQYLDNLGFGNTFKSVPQKHFLPSIYNRINSQSHLFEREKQKSDHAKKKQELGSKEEKLQTTKKQVQCVNVNKMRNSASMMNLRAKQQNRQEKEISQIQLNDVLDCQLKMAAEDQLSARSQTSEERVRAMNVKEYNKFRQKITNENLQYHLLAHNLSDNLKRLRIRWECENYNQLKSQIQGAITIKKNLKRFK